MSTDYLTTYRSSYLGDTEFKGAEPDDTRTTLTIVHACYISGVGEGHQSQDLE